VFIIPLVNNLKTFPKGIFITNKESVKYTNMLLNEIVLWKEEFEAELKTRERLYNKFMDNTMPSSFIRGKLFMLKEILDE